MRFPLVVCVFVCFAVIALPLHAQSPNGNINGLVSDPSSAAVADAEVVAANDVTGVQYTTKTNREGLYVLPNLPPGPYRVQVAKIGFKTLIKPDIVLNLQDSLSINFTLLVGAFHEIITVEGGAALVNTESASVSTVVDSRYVENMPLNGRSFQDLILLTPGTVTQSPQNTNAQLGQTGEFSVNGQRPESNYYTVDGVSANVGVAAGTSLLEWGGASGSIPAATALGTTQGLVSVDDLEEFRVQSSTYSAAYGRNPGGQISFDTKSGTNEWHGTAYDYLRNGAFDANDWFNDYFAVKLPALRQNDFGCTLGGSVKLPGYDGKDRTFFFFSYEGLRLVQPQSATLNYVPDLALRATTPAPLEQTMNAFPIPNAPDVGNGIAQFIGSWSNPSALDSTSIRFDHLANQKLRFFFRFGDTPSNSISRATGSFATPSMLKRSAFTSRTYTAGVNSVITTSASNEFRANYSSNQVVSTTAIDGFGGATALNLAQAAGLSSNAAPSVVLLYDGYELAVGQSHQAATQRQWNILDTAAISWKRHQLNFGADYRRLAPVATPFNPLSEYLYQSESDIQTNTAFVFSESIAPAYPLYRNLSLFVQDDWKAASKLNLSFGLRWELNPAPGVTQGLKPYTIEGATISTWTLAPQGTPLWNTTWYNFAPRFGIAYVLKDRAGYETVVRAGVGIFYDTAQQMGSYGFLGPGFSALNILPTASFPVSARQATPEISNPPIAPYNAPVIGFSRHLQLPYTTQWNVAVEQGFGKTQALTLGYVGSHAARLPQENEFDGPTIGNPNASSFFVFQNGLTSDYDSLQIQYRRRLSQGLTVLSSYTWSHCIDYGSQNYLYSYQRGSCDFDVRHNLSGALSYDVPVVGENQILRKLFGHWGTDTRFTARTAFPVTLGGLAAPDPTTGQYNYDGLDLVPGEPIYISGSECAAVYANGLLCPGNRAINPNAFAAPASGLGNAPRNFARGFGAWQWDLAIRREFPIYERLKLQFRAEGFNVLNHPNLGTINSNFGEPTFGQATATLANSLGILSPLYQMGGARSLQFALKLTF